MTNSNRALSIINKLKIFLNTGQERSVKVKKNILDSIIIRCVSILSSFILVPLTINYLNPTSYGIWITLSSIITWFSFFDIGFGNGLRNKFAESVAKNDFGLARKYVSTTYAILTILVVIILVIFLAIHHFLDWSKLLNAPSSMKDELSLTALIVFVFFCFKFVLELLNTVFKANQEPSKSSLIDFLGNLVSLLGIYILTKTTSGNLINLSFIIGISPVFILLLGSLWFYKGKYKKFAPSFLSIDFKLTYSLGSLGLKFFILQISAIVVYSTQNVIISHLFGPEEVTPYNISFKLFSTLTMIFTIISMPFWSAFTDAYIREDFDWIKKVLKKLNQFWYLIIVMALIILLFSPLIINIWVGDIVDVPFLLSLSIALYVTMHIWININITFLNGIGKIKLSLICSIIITIINIPLAIVLGKLLGVPGIPLAGTIIFILNGIVYQIQTDKILNKTAKGIWNS